MEAADSLCGAVPGGANARLVACRDRYGLEVLTWLSLRSGLLWSSPRLDKDSRRRFYEDDYRFMYTGAHAASHTVHLQQFVKGLGIRWWLQKKACILRLTQGSVVFDVGCSTGGALEAFRAIGCSVYGCDYGKEYLQYGRRRGLVLEQGSINALAKYGKADLIILSHVLEHVGKPLDLLRELKNHLKPKGLLYVAVPGARNITYDSNKFENDLLRYLHIAHVYHFTENTLSVAGTKVGLEPLASDQEVRVLFCKSEKVNPREWDSREADRVLQYFEKQERIRQKRIRTQGKRSLVRHRDGSLSWLLRSVNRCLFPFGFQLANAPHRASIPSLIRRVVKKVTNCILGLLGLTVVRFSKK